MGLIAPTNPFAYPGRNPGFRAAHPASRAPRFSGVAVNGTFVNLLKTGSPTVSGSPTAAMTGAGPGVKFAASGDMFTFPGTTETPTAVTIAAILTPTATTQTFGVVAGFGNPNTSTNDPSLELSSGTFKFYYAGNVQSLFLPSFAANVPYFVAFCLHNSTGASNQEVSAVMTNLQTGQVYSTASNGAITLNAITTANYRVGGFTGGSWGSNSVLHAAMLSAGQLTQQELTQWGRAPWAFWYPSPIVNPLSALKGGSVAASGRSRLIQGDVTPPLPTKSALAVLGVAALVRNPVTSRRRLFLPTLNKE